MHSDHSSLVLPVLCTRVPVPTAVPLRRGCHTAMDLLPTCRWLGCSTAVTAFPFGTREFQFPSGIPPPPTRRLQNPMINQIRPESCLVAPNNPKLLSPTEQAIKNMMS